MSRRSVARALGDAATRRAAVVAQPLARTPLGAGGLQAAIGAEAAARRSQRQWARAVARATGRTTQAQRRARAERAERARLAPDRPTRRGGPAVFWHETAATATGRPVVVLVNGWTASGLVWPASLVDRLAGRFRVVRIDNRGSGYSRTAPAPFTIARLADDVADVLRAIDVPRATIVGLSMGGMIAQELAIRRPGVVERLVLCGTRPPAPADVAPAAAVLDSLFETPDRGESLTDYFRRTWSPMAGPGFAAEHPDVIAELVARIAERPTPHAAVVAQMRAISSWYGSDRLTRIAVPTTVIHGRADPLLPVGNGMRIAQLVPGARYVELPEVGHLVPFEAPAAVADAVESHDGPPRRGGRRSHGTGSLAGRPGGE